jgi:hypothetical protein
MTVGLNRWLAWGRITKAAFCCFEQTFIKSDGKTRQFYWVFTFKKLSEMTVRHRIGAPAIHDWKQSECCWLYRDLHDGVELQLEAALLDGYTSYERVARFALEREALRLALRDRLNRVLFGAPRVGHILK